MNELKQQISQLTVKELKSRYKLYNQLQSTSVKDTIILSLLEVELHNRNISI
jgi:hypothetical protein